MTFIERMRSYFFFGEKASVISKELKTLTPSSLKFVDEQEVVSS